MVKTKTVIFQIFTPYAGRRRVWIFPALALLTFISSWIGAYSSAWVETVYAHRIFPAISLWAGRFADSVPFAWLDPAIALALVGLALILRKRRWMWIVNAVACLYLVFFWFWGLNYHRQPLSSKLQANPAAGQPAAIEEFSRRAASELNRLYPKKESQAYDESLTRAEAAKRVRRVVAIIDGTNWNAADRIKRSWLAAPWMRAAGVDGVFNPFGHEPIVTGSLLDIERPFIISHELAHVRGYPDEGDANVIAVFATLMSDDDRFQYSGWLNLWLYIRNRDRDRLLDPGPRRDLQRIFERARAEEIPFINGFQQALLDWFLKANDIEQGVRSYSRVVVLAAGTQPSWDRFR
jgi:Protein of unknown function (DUF3810)